MIIQNEKLDLNKFIPEGFEFEYETKMINNNNYHIWTLKSDKGAIVANGYPDRISYTAETATGLHCEYNFSEWMGSINSYTVAKEDEKGAKYNEIMKCNCIEDGSSVQFDECIVDLLPYASLNDEGISEKIDDNLHKKILEILLNRYNLWML